MEEKKELPPITLPNGKRTEGTLLNVPVKRLTKPSDYLKSLMPKKPKRNLKQKTEINVAYGHFVRGRK